MIAKRRQTPFEANIVLLTVFVLDKFVVFLIDGVVCQVHVAIVFIEFGGVAFRGESSKTFLVDIYSKRFIACNDNVNPQVKLMTVNEEWVGDVPANDACFIDIELVKRLNNVYASTT